MQLESHCSQSEPPETLGEIIYNNQQARLSVLIPCQHTSFQQHGRNHDSPLKIEMALINNTMSLISHILSAHSEHQSSLSKCFRLKKHLICILYYYFTGGRQMRLPLSVTHRFQLFFSNRVNIKYQSELDPFLIRFEEADFQKGLRWLS